MCTRPGARCKHHSHEGRDKTTVAGASRAPHRHRLHDGNKPLRDQALPSRGSIEALDDFLSQVDGISDEQEYAVIALKDDREAFLSAHGTNDLK